MKSVAFHNLGCKVNSYEIDVMQQMLQEKGYSVVSFDEYADIYIINTCTVTNMADRKSRQMLHRAKKQNPNAIVVAVGCYVQTGSEAVKDDDCIDLAIGNNRKKDIASILEQFLVERGLDQDFYEEAIIDINHTNEYEEMQLTQTSEHTRAYIKIQDGCNQFCSYCIIPYARGRVRSRRAEDIIREVSALVEKGYREIVLTGIHISSYGIDFKSADTTQDAETTGVTQDYQGNRGHLIALIEELHAIEGLERIRLGSLEPRIMTYEFVKTLSGLTKICPHFHLSLQSGCDLTLKRMNRRYTAAEYADTVATLRHFFPECAVTTDVIVGFPGETEEEFEETRRYLEELKLYEMHIFKYSRRHGTRADQMPDQVPDQVKNVRSDILLAMEERFSREYREQFIGRTLQVLLEEPKQINGVWYATGHSREYIQTAVACGQSEEKARALQGSIATVVPQKISQNGLFLMDC